MAVHVKDVCTELVFPLSDEEASLAADRCLECGGHAAAPCVVACPAHVDVPTFVGQIAAGDALGAAETIFAENLLGGSCARVCPVEELCQGACVLLHEGRDAVEIGRLQRYATEKGFAAGVPLRRPSQVRHAGRVAVVGAGPAGLACAGELAARGFPVTVYDERAELGGLARYAIAPYRLMNDPLPEEAAALVMFGVEFELDTPIDSPEKLRELELRSEAIFLGIGMGGDADISYPGDDLAGVWQSLPFVEQLKTGSAPRVGDDVVVVGGGNTAIDVAVESKRLGAERVTMVYRRSEAEMPAYAAEVELAREEGVEIAFLTNPVRIVGDDGRVTGVECVEMRLGEPDESGRRRPKAVPGSEFLVPADTVILALGQRPRDGFLAWIDGVELAGGRLVVDEHGRTGNAKYFAGGDAVNGGATVVEAVRGAKVAAAAIEEALLS